MITDQQLLNPIPRSIIVGDTFKEICRNSTELAVYGYITTAGPHGSGVLVPTRVLAWMTGNDTPAIRKALRVMTGNGVIEQIEPSRRGNPAICAVKNPPDYQMYITLPVARNQGEVQPFVGLDLFVLRILTFYSRGGSSAVTDYMRKLQTFLPDAVGRIKSSIKRLVDQGTIAPEKFITPYGRMTVQGYRVLSLKEGAPASKAKEDKPELLSVKEGMARLEEVLDPREWAEYCEQLGLTMSQLKEKLRDPSWELPDFDPGYGAGVERPMEEDVPPPDYTVVTPEMKAEALKYLQENKRIPDWLKMVNNARIAAGMLPVDLLEE